MTSLTVTDADLSICGRDAQQIARVAVASAGIAGALAMLGCVALVGPSQASGSLLAAGVVLGAALVAFSAPIRKVQTDARRRRREMEAALATFLDVVNILLAGGAGTETAILAGADASRGWPFIAMRHALTRATSRGTTFWDELAELGRATGVPVLVEVAHSVRLAGEQGARVRASLAAKAASLRARQIAEIEHRAHESTEQMGLPMVLMFLGFVLLLGYPAYVDTMTAL